MRGGVRLNGSYFEYLCMECGAIKHWKLDGFVEDDVRKTAEQEIKAHNEGHAKKRLTAFDAAVGEGERKV